MLDFPSWFTGMFGADGSFAIKNSRKTFRCSMQITLRDDDAEVLHKIQEYFRVGTVIPRKAYGLWKPQVDWTISANRDCLRMVEHFDKYPLQCKKAKHYKSWRLAVLEIQKPRNIRDNHYLAILKQQHQEAKKYGGNPDYNFSCS